MIYKTNFNVYLVITSNNYLFLLVLIVSFVMWHWLTFCILPPWGGTHVTNKNDFCVKKKFRQKFKNAMGRKFCEAYIDFGSAGMSQLFLFFFFIFGLTIITVFIRHLINSTKSRSNYHFRKLCSWFRSGHSFFCHSNWVFRSNQRYITISHQGALDIKLSELRLCIHVLCESFKSELLNRKYAVRYKLNDEKLRKHNTFEAREFWTWKFFYLLKGFR